MRLLVRLDRPAPDASVLKGLSTYIAKVINNFTSSFLIYVMHLLVPLSLNFETLTFIVWLMGHFDYFE